jgi:hypothetical protein
MKINCNICGKEFKVFPCHVKRGKKYCSRKCLTEMNKKRCGEKSKNWKGGQHVESTCLFCGVKFMAEKKAVKNGYGKFCSHYCASKLRSKKKWDNPMYKGGGYEAAKRYRAKNKSRVLAWNILNEAVKNKSIKKEACSICGDKKVVAHHEDYSKPLDIIWLCHDHHNKLHRSRSTWRPHKRDFRR